MRRASKTIQIKGKMIFGQKSSARGTSKLNKDVLVDDIRNQMFGSFMDNERPEETCAEDLEEQWVTEATRSPEAGAHKIRENRIERSRASSSPKKKWQSAHSPLKNSPQKMSSPS